mmetsp:Transcript_5772/g.8497  ORF Transcript_5772/g.8497 Transcript_5772/m.8497 type:complete len:451 (+) Transcript_5772:12-1364(+)
MQRITTSSLKHTLKRTSHRSSSSIRHVYTPTLSLNNHILRHRQHAGALTMSPYFRDWESRWMEKGNYYTYLLHQDEQIRSYFEGLFYRLRVPTGEFLIERHHDMILITTDIYIPESHLKKAKMPEHLRYLLASSNLKDLPTHTKENLSSVQEQLEESQTNSKNKIFEKTTSVLGERGTFEFYDCLNAMEVATQPVDELPNHLMEQSVEDEENLIHFYQSKMRSIYETEQEFEENKRKIMQMAEDQLPVNQNLIEKIEQTITNYTGIPTYFVPNTFVTHPPMRSPRLVGETLRLILEENGSNVNDAFGLLKRWQKAEQQSKRTVPFEQLPPETKKKLSGDFLATNPAFAITHEKLSAGSNDFLQDRVFPVAGVRVEVKGITKKATRKAHLRYQDWASDPDLTGSVQVDPARHIMFHSTQALRPEGMMGIKVWLSLKTRRTDSKGREIRAHE